MAIATAPKKEASATRTDMAKQVDGLFWSTFHGGQYERIPAALEAQTGAYLGDPGDHVSAAHAGWLHIWRLAENARTGDKPPATITDDIRLSRKYFAEAVALNPKEARYLGFLASATLAEASIDKNERQTREGWFMMLDAVKAWPEFNMFTAGYVMSPQPADSPRFKQGLEWQWETLDLCVGEKVDRTNVDYGKYMRLETREGVKRVCWNSWIAPHNFEGFFMNMGDMLVKSGDWKTGQKIYATAKLSRTYDQWKYKDVLERRIGDAESNVANFNAKGITDDSKRIMNGTRFSCMACHQD